MVEMFTVQKPSAIAGGFNFVVCFFFNQSKHPEIVVRIEGANFN